MLDTLLRQFLLLLQPVGMVWLLLLIVAVQSGRRRQWRSMGMAGFLFALVTVVGSTDLPGWLLRRLEAPWTGFQPASAPVCDAVVVLGGGAEPSRYEVGQMHLTKAGDRLVMGMELVRLGKAPVLVVGGAGAQFEDGMKVEADLVKAWAENWRPAGMREVISLGLCAHTRDEAEKVAKLAKERGWKRVLLVTSANHMNRAAGVFRAVGVEFTPAPCNFLTTLSTAPAPFRLSVPTAGGFEKVQTWMHETVGWITYQRRGWVKE